MRCSAAPPTPGCFAQSLSFEQRRSVQRYKHTWLTNARASVGKFSLLFSSMICIIMFVAGSERCKVRQKLEAIVGPVGFSEGIIVGKSSVYEDDLTSRQEFVKPRLWNGESRNVHRCECCSIRSDHPVYSGRVVYEPWLWPSSAILGIACPRSCNIKSWGLSRIPKNDADLQRLGNLGGSGKRLDLIYTHPRSLVQMKVVNGGLQGFLRSLPRCLAGEFGNPRLSLQSIYGIVYTLIDTPSTLRKALSSSGVVISRMSAHLGGSYQLVSLPRSPDQDPNLDHSTERDNAGKVRHYSVRKSMLLPTLPSRFWGWALVGVGAVLLLTGQFYAFLFPNGSRRSVGWWWGGLAGIATGCWIIHVGIKLALFS